MKIDISKRQIRYQDPTKLEIIDGPVEIAGNVTITGDLTVVGDEVTTGTETQTGDLDVIGAVGAREASADAGSEVRLVHNQVIHTIVGGGLTETLTAAIPANAWVMGVHAKIKVDVVADTGVSFLLGVTGDTNRFGNFAALTKNTAQTPANHQVEAVGVGRFYAAATDVLLTLNAGTFTSGVVTVDIYYMDLSPVDNYA